MKSGLDIDHILKMICDDLAQSLPSALSANMMSKFNITFLFVL